MKRVLVIGAGGQDGRILSRKLILENTVTYVHSSSIKVTEPFKDASSINFYDLQETREFLKYSKFSEIYFLGAQSSVGKSFIDPCGTFQSNTIPVLHVLESIRSVTPHTKLFHPASGDMFGSCTAKGACEDTPFSPKSPYAVSKVAAYNLVQNFRQCYGLHVVNGILFNHESFYRDERFVTGKIVNSALRIARGQQDKLELGNIHIKRDWGCAHEYMDAALLQMRAEVPNDYVIATGKTTSLLDFCEITFSCLGLNHQDYVMTRDQQLRPMDIDVTYGDPRKIKADLGWFAKKQLPEMIADWIYNLNAA